jgi:Outer membrane lipoprotein-sorting protein
MPFLRSHLLAQAFTFGLAVAVVPAVSLAADDAKLSADEIANRTLRADAFVWEGNKTVLRMILVTPDGKRQERSLEVLARREHGKIQSLLRFSAPQNLAGTAFLSREQPDGSSEQYVYLSGLKRTRRIVGRERDESFMGSDFSYSDMQRIDPKWTHHSRQSDERIGNDDCYVIESKVALESGSRYSKLVTWVRKSDFVASRTRFFDKQGALVKTLYARRVREMQGKPVVVEARMQSQNGHATELVIDAMDRRNDLDDATFSPNALERF